MFVALLNTLYHAILEARTAVGIMFPDKRRNTFLMLRRGLISLRLLLFPVFRFATQPKEFFFGSVKEVRTTKS
jgi:hypothetical protein